MEKMANLKLPQSPSFATIWADGARKTTGIEHIEALPNRHPSTSPAGIAHGKLELWIATCRISTTDPPRGYHSASASFNGERRIGGDPTIGVRLTLPGGFRRLTAFALKFEESNV